MNGWQVLGIILWIIIGLGSIFWLEHRKAKWEREHYIKFAARMKKAIDDGVEQGIKEAKEYYNNFRNPPQ